MDDANFMIDRLKQIGGNKYGQRGNQRNHHGETKQMASNGPLLDSKIDYTTTAAMLNMSQYSYSTLNNSTLHQKQSLVVRIFLNDFQREALSMLKVRPTLIS